MAKSKGKSAKAPQATKGLGPNPAPQTPEHKSALKLTCRYLGKTFYEGDKIQYRGSDWKCHQGQWVKAEEVNPNDLAHPQTESDSAALQGATCMFLGKTRYEGDLACWQGNEFVCRSGQWVKTGNSC